MALIFQYGSNTSIRRINSPARLQGEAKPLGLAQTLEEFRFEFSVWSKANGCAAANLTPGIGRRAWGVLYDIPEHRIFRHMSRGGQTLDEIEGQNYVRSSIEVIPANSAEKVTALTYLVKNPQPDLQTNAAYVSHILSGLREHSAPLEYLEYIEECIFENNPALRIPEGNS